jgi:integrase/recombinase XerC
MQVDAGKNSSHNVLASFLDDLLAQHLSEATVAAYRADLLDFARWYKETTGEALEPHLVTELDLAEYRRHLVQKKKKPATVNRRLVAIGKWLDWALEKGLVAKRPKMPRQVRQEKLAPRALSKSRTLCCGRWKGAARSATARRSTCSSSAGCAWGSWWG